MAPLIETFDRYGVKTSSRTENWSTGRITDVVYQDIQEIAMITDTPVEPIAQSWAAQAAITPLKPWAPTFTAPVLELSSYQGQGIGPVEKGSTSPLLCDLLALVPGLGIWMGPGCLIMSEINIFDSVTRWVHLFKKHRWALYYRGKLMAVITTASVDDFMSSTKRAIRDLIRIRRSG